MILLLPAFIILLYLLADHCSLRMIKFRPEGEVYWQIAFSEEHLRAKLDGRMAEVIMPAKPIAVRLWRLFFPLKGIEI